MSDNKKGNNPFGWIPDIFKLIPAFLKAICDIETKSKVGKVNLIAWLVMCFLSIIALVFYGGQMWALAGQGKDFSLVRIVIELMLPIFGSLIVCVLIVKGCQFFNFDL